MNDTTGLAESSLILSFKPEISLIERSDGQTFLYASSLEIPLSQASPGLLASLRLLSTQGGAEEELANLMEQHDGPWSLSTLFYYLQRFNRLGLLCHTLTWDGAELATILPISPTYRFRLIQPVPDVPYILSRFAYLRRNNRQFVLESPCGQAKLILHHHLSTAILHALAVQPLTFEALARQFQEIPETSLSLFMSLLLCCKALAAEDETGPAPQNESLAQWDFHDLLFHTRSRLGRHANPYGEHLRFLNQIPPLPAVKPPMSNETISLFRPDIQTLKENDLNFTQVLEERRSYRQQGEQPVTVEELGEFLFRAARVRAIFQADDLLYECSNRPYPGGGAGYELELYLAANRCQGLPFGLYHYDPQAHQLYKLASRPELIHSLLDDAALSAGRQQRPQILIILAARFQRVSWKYESLAYALILKDVGVLYQTMYLVATAMNLAPCALGGGNSDLFAAAVGTDYYAETSVGEFILGSR